MRKYTILTGMLSLVLMAGLVGCGDTTAAGVASEAAASVVEAAEDTADAAADLTASVAGEEAVQEVADAVQEALTDAVPQRVVALGESNAELWLLSGGSLVGVSEDAMDLENLTEGCVSVGELEKPSVESITALEPDLVICFSSSPGQKAAGERMQELGTKVLFTNIDNFGDYATVMKGMTDLLGTADLYQKNVADVQQGIDDVIAKVPASENKPNYLMLHVSATKSKVEKNDYFATEIFNNLGMTNIIEDDSNMDEINLEAVMKEDPDYIFVVPRGSDKKAKAAFEEQFENDPAWQELKAVKDGHVYVLPKEFFGLKPNAQWAEAYQYAYDILYGDAK